MLFPFILLLPSTESSLSPRWKPSPSLPSPSSFLARTHRQSEGNHHFFSLNQPYYTRPEDFSIPSYSPPKPGESKERSFVPPSVLHQGSLGFFPPSSRISPPSSKPRFQYPQSFPYPYETPSTLPTPPPINSPSIPREGEYGTPSSLQSTTVSSPTQSSTSPLPYSVNTVTSPSSLLPQSSTTTLVGPTGPTGYENRATDNYNIPHSSSIPYSPRAPSEKQYPTTSSSYPQYPSHSPSDLPYPTPSPTDLPYPSPSPTNLPNHSPSPNDRPYPTRDSSNPQYPSHSPSELPYPSPSPTDLPNHSSSPNDRPYPTPSPTDLPYPSPSPTDLPYHSPSPNDRPYPTRDSSNPQYPSHSPSELPYPSPSPTDLPYHSPSPNDRPYPSPSPTDLPYHSPSPNDRPYPTRGSSNPQYPSHSPSELPYPSPSPTDLPYHSPSPNDRPYPSPSPTDLPYHSPSPNDRPYPIRGSSNPQYPSHSPSELPYPSPSPTDLPYHSPAPNDRPYPSPSPTGLPYPSPSPNDRPYPTPGSSNPQYPSHSPSELPYPTPSSSELPYSSASSYRPPSKTLSPYFTGNRSSPPPYRTPHIGRPAVTHGSPPAGISTQSTVIYPTLNPTNGYSIPSRGNTPHTQYSPSTHGYSTESRNPSELDGYSTRSGFNPFQSSSTHSPKITQVPVGYGSTNPYEGGQSPVVTVYKGISSPPAHVPPHFKEELEGRNNGYETVISGPTNSPSSSISTHLPIPPSYSNPSVPRESPETTPLHPGYTVSTPSDGYDRSDVSTPYSGPSPPYRPSSPTGRTTTSLLSSSNYNPGGTAPPSPSTTHPYSSSDSTPGYRNPSDDSDYTNPSTVSPSNRESIPTVSRGPSGGPQPPPSSGIYSVDCIDCTPRPSNLSIYSPPRGGPKFIIHNETDSAGPPSSNPYSFFSTTPPGEHSTASYDLPPPPPGSNETKVIGNRIKGMAHILCMEKGVEVNAFTVRPFDGTVATVIDGKRKCIESFTGVSTNVSLFFSYEECGFRKKNVDENSSQWETQVVFTFPSSEDSFLVQCESQSIKYEKGSLPRRFEESLEEFQLIPIKIEQKAPLPYILWSLTEHNLTEVEIGTQQAMYFNLTPQTEAYGFHVKNCFVIDEKNGDRHSVIDRKGCSSDMAAFTHPQYNTLSDTMTSDWMAFKLPDHASLNISCSYSICPEFPSSSGDNSSFCSTIPTPPLCPRTVITPLNSLGSYQAHTKRSSADGEMTQRVEASLQSMDPSETILDVSLTPSTFTCFSPFSFILIPTLSSTSIVIASVLHLVSRRFHH